MPRCISVVVDYLVAGHCLAVPGKKYCLQLLCYGWCHLEKELSDPVSWQRLS